MIFANDFIGQDKAGKTMYFYGGDEEDTLIKNLQDMPADWYYRDKTITYVFNSNGHRSKEIEEIDLDNYILFTGCSHTEGIGLEIETTFPYLISKQLGCDYYNLGIAASGIDVMEYNLLTWFHKVEKKPKFVVIQWPDHSRYVTYGEDNIHILPNGTWNAQDHHKTFLLSSEESGFFNARKYIALNMIENIIDVPIIKMTFSSLAQYDGNSLILRKLDLARDRSHTGIKSHESIANQIIEEYKRVSPNAFIS